MNIITGWQRPEYSQMGLWPGDEYFCTALRVVAEYVTIMRELWETGHSNFKGEHFQMEDCRLLPKPQVPIKLICAGQSDAGMAFTAARRLQFLLRQGLQHADRVRAHGRRLPGGTCQERPRGRDLRAVHDHRRTRPTRRRWPSGSSTRRAPTRRRWSG